MFTERFKLYLQYEKRFSSHTLTAYISDLEQFSNFLSLNDLDFSSITHQDIRLWMVHLLEDEISHKSVSRKISTIKSFYKFLSREKLISINPTLQLKAPKIPKRLPVVIPESNMNTLLDSEDIFKEDFEGVRDRLILELLFGTGMRLSELLTIKESDISIYDQQVRIFGKRSRERIVPLNAELVSLIKAYIKCKHSQNFTNPSTTLIVTAEGKVAYAQLIYRTVKKYLAYVTTNSKKSPHVLRHTFATSLLNNGADLNAIKELLGHASLAATQIYTHNSVEKLKSIYKQAHPRA